ncbi:hypothetical protein BLA29_003527, partial [Euroglyphus maynei]
DDFQQRQGAKPTLTEKPLLKKVGTGQVQFEIRLVADPEPQIEWYHQDNPIIKSGQFESKQFRCQILTDRHNHLVSLTFLKPQPSDAGQYRFVARNHFGVVETYFDLPFGSDGRPIVSMAVAPRFPKKPTIRQKGNVLILECVLEANPYPEITWYHGTKVISDDSRHKTTRTESGENMYALALEIINPTLEDGGTYRCNAINDKGESNANIALNFQSNYPFFRVRVDNISNHSIHSSIAGDDEDKDGPTFIGKPRIIPKDSSITMECRCLVKNDAGEITANLALNIEGAPEDDSIYPKFVDKPRIISEKDGSLIIMECRVKARPKPDITWFQDGVPVKQNARIKQTMVKEKEDDTYLIRMEINDADMEDSGMYKCNVKNSAGQSVANMSLSIEIIPVISQRPRIIRREQQQKIVIECAVKSANKPQITWIRESLTVRQDSRHQIIVREERKGEYVIALEIDEPTEKDNGAYKMKAKNEKGEVVTEDIIVRVDDQKKKKDNEEEEEEREKRASKKAKKQVSEPRVIRGLRSEVSNHLTTQHSRFHISILIHTESASRRIIGNVLRIRIGGGC